MFNESEEKEQEKETEGVCAAVFTARAWDARLAGALLL